MRHLLIVCLMGLTACAGGSGGSTPAVGTTTPNTPPPLCKPIKSVWTSTTDQERFDLTGVAENTPVGEFEYRAYDGVTCGYTTNPNHTLTAYLEARDPLSTIVGHDWTLVMRWSLAMGGQCATWSPNDPSLDSAVYMKLECNKITACKSPYLPFGGAGCKEFQ